MKSVLHRSLAFLFLIAVQPVVLAEPIDADLLLANGSIVDGSGDEASNGSVAIREGKIVAVGEFDVGNVGKTVDCQGKIICPGFIDLHNHSDRSLLTEGTKRAACYLTQGCTTLVTGNCGSGPVDAAEYYDSLETEGIGINVAHLLPHSSMRDQVMGSNRRPPSDAELQQMRDLADQAMADGVWGMSTGLQYVPGAYADTDELVAIAERVAAHGGIYASHMRDESNELLEAVEETLEIGRRAHLPIHISHFKSTKRPNWGKIRIAADRVEQAQQLGMEVTADQYPYIASSTSIMAMLLSDEEREGGNRAASKRLEDPEVAARLKPMVAEALDARDRIMIASSKQHPDWVGKLIREVAAEENCEPIEIAMTLLLDSGAQGVNFSMSEADVRYLMTKPWVATASDGSSKIDDGTRPHPRSFGTFPRKIGRYANQESVISVEQAVRSSSGLPADILELKDRGYLRPGYVADVVVIDIDQLSDHATFDEPFNVSTGVEWVFLAGEPAVAAGEVTEELHGRPLRRKSAKQVE